MSQSENNSKTWSEWHNRLHKTLKNKKHLLPKEASLLLAVSGGQDSMALTKLILDLQKLYKWELHVWHGDHGWHKDSTKFAKELKDWCEQNNLNFYSEKACIDEIKNEEAARNWRYQALTKKAEDLSKETYLNPLHHIVTGHTGSDRAETVLINLARGTHLKGLSSLKESRAIKGTIKVIRPLLCFSRSETAKICSDMNLPVWVDPSNKEDYFTRNKIRKNVIPILEELYPGSSMRISSLSGRLASFNDDQVALTSLAIESLTTSEGLCREKLYKISNSVRSNILAQWLGERGAPNINAILIEELSRVIGKGKPPGTRILSKGWEFLWTKDSIKLLEPS